MGKLNIQLS